MNNDGGAGGSEEDRVARFLAENPDWLATQTELYEVLSPPGACTATRWPTTWRR